MPLVDGEQQPIDYELSRILESKLKRDDDGHIFDDEGNSLILWKVNELETWWIQFEKIIGLAMGRKLVNAACDEEEYHLSKDAQFQAGGLFKNSRRKKLLQSRWLCYGWGQLDLDKQQISSPTLAPFCVGIALASIEYQKNKRYKITWNQPNSELINLNLEEEIRVISPSKAAHTFSWTKKCFEYHPTLREIGQFQVVSKNGSWDYEGERMVLIPVNILTRLLYSAQDRTLAVAEELRQSIHFIGLGEGEKSAFLCAALAMSNVIEQSERPVYILSDSQWLDKCHNLLAKFGLICPVDCNSLDENGSVEFSFNHSPTLPFSIGALMAFWQRAHGKLAKITIHFSPEKCKVEVSSKLQYNP